MLNMIKMDVFRMFKTKSLYIIGIIMFAMTVMTTLFVAEELNTMASEGQNVQEGVYGGVTDEQSVTKEEGETIIGITVDVPAESKTNFTVYDIVYANFQGKAILLYMVIFTVIFATADISSGYIKNFAGQLKSRWKLVFSKAITLFFFTIMAVLIYTLMQTVCTWIVFRNFEIGDVTNMLSYLGLQTILHYSIICVCMAFAIIFRNNLCSMSLSICICFGVTNVLYSFIDKILAKIGMENFATMKYTITGRIGSLSMEPTGSDAGKCIFIAAMFILVFVGTCSYVFQKRDV